jgi:hypothetical protein
MTGVKTVKSDVIHVTSGGAVKAEAVKQAEAVSVFKGLSKPDSIHLLLLTEEMLGMMQALTGELEGDFWIEDENGTFTLHLKVETEMNAEKREKLLSASTSGENIAAKGIMGKIRDIFSRVLEAADSSFPLAYEAGLLYAESGELITPVYRAASISGDPASPFMSVWSLNKYKSETGAPDENWDELEKSVVANIADEVQIGIAGNIVEMIIYKKCN